MSDGHERQVRIVSDGTSFGTKVYVRGGNGSDMQLTTVSKAEWALAANDGHAKARLTLHDVEVDVFGSSSMATAASADGANRRWGDEPWTERPFGLAIAALPEVNSMEIGGHRIRAYGSWDGQHGLIGVLEHEARKRKAYKMFVSKCYFRLLECRRADERTLREQHYCYAVFV